MKIKDLTDAQIKKFAGATIYQRGYVYYQSDLVRGLTYDADAESLQARVDGNYGEYEIGVYLIGDLVKASCTCPYEGYPCKHVVATLLTYIKDYDKYHRAAREKAKSFSQVEAQLRSLSQQELIKIILGCIQKYPDFKREMIVKFTGGNDSTRLMLLQQIAAAFPDPRSRSYSTEKIAKDLQGILTSVEQAPAALSTEIYWAAADGILNELTQYGMDDAYLEELLFDALEELQKVLKKNVSIKEKRQEVIGKLMKYYINGNCGVVDAIYDAAAGLCQEKSDYQILIDKLTPVAKSSSYKRDLLAGLYEMIGDDRARLRVLESHLEYGMDYWELARYWLEKGDGSKAAEVVQAGVDKGKGRKDELYQYLLEQLLNREDYAGLGQLLREKIQRNDVHRGGLRQDPVYQALNRHFQSTGDYEGQRNLLMMCLAPEEIDLKLYREAGQVLQQEHCREFREGLIDLLEKDLKKQGKTEYWRPGHSREVLADIYHANRDFDQLFNLVKKHPELLEKFAASLQRHQPDFYLKHFSGKAAGLIKQRGRENYKAAVACLRSIKTIFEKHLMQPDAWRDYLTQLKQDHKTLRALQEELQGL